MTPGQSHFQASAAPPLRSLTLRLTLSGQMQQVRLHVLHLVLEDVGVELEDGQDVLGQRSWDQVVPVHHLPGHEADHWRHGRAVAL